MKKTLLCFCLVLAVVFACGRRTRAQDAAGEHLKFVLVLIRHGVRSPTWSNARLDEYSRQPWPKSDVAPGWLTPHGKLLMTQLGAYYRARLSSRGLLSASGCTDAANVYIHADSDERTRDSGEGIAEGMMPGCHVDMHVAPEGVHDSLFHPDSKVAKPDSQLAYAAIAGRIGEAPAALLPAFQQQLDAMQDVLFDCVTPGCSADGKKSMLEIEPSLLSGMNGHLAKLNGPLSTGATFAENFQLEYLEGMPDAQVGWGRVDEAKMRALMAIHAENSWVTRRAPYLAQVQGSNLLWHITRTLEQAARQEPVDGAMGAPRDKVVFLVGHDTNISNVAALLGAHWLLRGYQPDDTPPGGALVFELWQRSGRSDEVRAYYIAQSPDQMRHALRLSLASPPEKAELFLWGRSQGSSAFACDWSAFERLVLSQSDRAFVQ